jgi:hypothetical protein
MEYSSPLGSGLSLVSLALGLVVFVVLFAGLRNGFRQAQREHQVLTRGTVAPAIIRQVRQTGTMTSEGPELEFEVLVSPEDGTAFHGRCQKLVSLLDLHRAQVGAQVHVCYDPEDKTHVVFVGFGPIPPRYESDAIAFELTRQR